MFGHQNDIISQDQRASASVPLPEEAIDALTAAPATTSTTDNHDPVTTAPATDPQQQPADNTDQTTGMSTVISPAQSVDGVIPPPGQGAPPTSGMTFPSYTTSPSDSSSAPAADEPADSPPDAPVPDDSMAPSPQPEPATPPLPSVEEAQTPPIQPIKLSPNPEELLTIKNQALNSLSPLVGKLDVPPEEKFRTLMMLIQASDNHALLSEAYELAQAIPDEKARAQALLDVVNEINYFTSKSK